MKEQIIKHLLSTLTSKKFITVIYSLTWLFILLLLVILKTCPVQEGLVNVLLIAIGSVFTAFVGGNVAGDHYFDGKNKNNKDNKDIPLEEIKK
jgi:hypothetical protein